MIETACNEYILVIRDKTETEKDGLYLPPNGRDKPYTGIIQAIGALVKDPELKMAKGKKCLWHKTVGQEFEYDGIVYLSLRDEEIIALP